MAAGIGQPIQKKKAAVSPGSERSGIVKELHESITAMQGKNIFGYKIQPIKDQSIILNEGFR